ncbi:MAG: hypothetical protein OXQ31_02175, partial [Spirochaetaceae bacterium]|nr:hypothetical protein [Spirochaetaceae bacterium]
ATVNDDADEPDGTVTVSVTTGDGYVVAAAPDDAAGVTVKDDDDPVLSVADVTVTESKITSVMSFTVRLSAPSAETVTVHAQTRDSTPVSARAREDYAPRARAPLSFKAGETAKEVPIVIYADSHDEEPETFELVLSDAVGAVIADGVAVATIVNDDPMPAAWLARFGRTVAEQSLEGIAARMTASRTPGMQGAVAGQALPFDQAASGTPAGFGHDPFGAPATQWHTMTAHEALPGSGFELTGETDGAGGSMAFWGRAGQGSFEGREGTFSLDGEATTALLGTDYAGDRWLIGLALAQSAGEGGYHDTEVTPRPGTQTCDAENDERCRDAVRAGDGTVEALLTAAIPYAALQASNRLTLWGAAGYGFGEVTLETVTGKRYGADTNWSMAAAGLRGELLAPASGPALAVTSDALWTRSASEKTRDLAASASGVTRLRLGLEGSWRVVFEGGSRLVPRLEVGARHDGGDAETGLGLELGGSLQWGDPRLGLSLDLSGRTLLAHGDGDLKDWGYAASLVFDPDPASARGVSLSLRQDWGGQATGGLDALFQPATLEDRTGNEATSRWAMEAAYGFPAFDGSFIGSPHVGIGLSTAERDYSLGWRWTPEAATAPDVSLGLSATRTESDTQAPEHTVTVEVRAAW